MTAIIVLAPIMILVVLFSRGAAILGARADGEDQP